MPTRRDLALAALSVAGLLVCALVVWRFVMAPVAEPRPLAWGAAAYDARAQTVTVSYEQPCGSQHARTDVEVDAEHVVVTVFVRGFALFCSQEYRVHEVTVPVPEPITGSVSVVDGSRV